MQMVASLRPKVLSSTYSIRIIIEYSHEIFGLSFPLHLTILRLEKIHDRGAH